jgi:hypothetical protein
MNRKKYWLFLIFLIGSLLPGQTKAQFETFKDSVVQLYGVVMTADSLRGLPAVSIMVKGQNRGTLSNDAGVFSIVVLKGDRVEFSSVGFKTKLVEIPQNLTGNHFSIIQLMVADTQYLPATIIRQRLTREQFERDFVNTQVPADEIEIARANNNQASRRFLMSTLPADGREASARYMRQQARKLYYSGQIQPISVLNPIAWSEFIKAWKRGDFKKSK